MSIKEFKSTLLQNGNIDAGYIEIPFDVQKEYGSKRVKVKALLNGVEYRGSILRMGMPCHILGIPKAIRSKMGVAFGDMIEVRLERDEEERVVTLPDDLKRQLNEKALLAFQNLSYSRQRKYVLSIEDAKQEATRAKRIAKIAAEMENK
ncbi:MAG: DUF1905 domain-containing protein [Lachnospiraceae bacterium]